jgi:hypothetical protein
VGNFTSALLGNFTSALTLGLQVDPHPVPMLAGEDTL